MSHLDYQEGITIASHDYAFKALIMAAMRKADPDNMEKLTAAFPETYQELLERYNSPGGYLEGERIRPTG